MMHHPIIHLISSFLSAAAFLCGVGGLAIKAETSARQWPWIIAFIGAVLLGTFFWGVESFLSDAYQAGIPLP